MKAKIGFMFTLFVNDEDNQQYWFKEVGGGLQSGTVIDVLDKINDVSEYKLYNSLFNEVKLLGVSVKFTPQNSTMQRNSNPVTVYCTYKKSNYLTDPVALTPVSIIKRYYRNFDRKWVPADQTQDIINQGRDLDFWLDTGSKSTANSANSATWFVEVNAYVCFRKNLSL